MNLLGLHLQLLIGQTVPAPAPLKLNEALESVQVTHKDEGRSGFQLVFQIGRRALDLMDYSLLKNPLIQPFNRVLLNVIFGVTPQPIMDGIITNQQLAPSDDPGASKLTLMGEDVTLMMDLEKKSQEYPGRTDFEIVEEIFGRYGEYGITFGLLSLLRLLFLLLPRRTPEERTTQQARQTDLEFVTKLAENHGYVFYVEPGPAPKVNTAYWGPPNRFGSRQGALSVNMGPNTNVESINFKYNGLAATKVVFTLENGQDAPPLERSTRQPPLASHPAISRKQVYFTRPDSMSDSEVRERAQEQVNKSFEQVVTANGSLDALRYGRILKPRGLVDLRGAGESYDGTYYVKSVTHNINVRKGEYKQTFVLTREGVGTTTPFVSP
jgi:hypothetical protein